MDHVRALRVGLTDLVFAHGARADGQSFVITIDLVHEIQVVRVGFGEPALADHVWRRRGARVEAAKKAVVERGTGQRALVRPLSDEARVVALPHSVAHEALAPKDTVVQDALPRTACAKWHGVRACALLRRRANAHSLRVAREPLVRRLLHAPHDPLPGGTRHGGIEELTAASAVQGSTVVDAPGVILQIVCGAEAYYVVATAEAKVVGARHGDERAQTGSKDDGRGTILPPPSIFR